MADISLQNDHAALDPSDNSANLPGSGDQDLAASVQDAALSIYSQADKSSSNTLSKALHPPSTFTLPNRASSQHQRAYTKLSVCRADVRFLRTQVEVSWQIHHRFRDLYSQSHVQYYAALSRTRSLDESGARNIRLRREQVDRDRTRLEAQHATASTLEQRLAELTERMLSLTDDLMLAHRPSQGPSHSAASMSHAVLRSSSSSSIGSGSELSSRLDERLARYYDRAGDVKIQAERRDDLEHDYHRDLENRRLRQDRGDLLNLHDDDFTFLYERERDIYDTELQLAIDSADELRKICTEAGLEISVGKLDQSDVGEHDASSSSTLDLPKVISPDRAPSPFSLAFSRLMRGGTKSSMEGISVFEMDLMSNMELDASNEDESLTHIARWVEDTQEGIPASSSADATYYSSFAARSGPYTVPALSRRQSPNRSSRPSLKPKSESDVLNTMTQPIGAIADLPEHAHRDVTN